jgi:hypothetical protein
VKTINAGFAASFGGTVPAAAVPTVERLVELANTREPPAGVDWERLSPVQLAAALQLGGPVGAAVTAASLDPARLSGGVRRGMEVALLHAVVRDARARWAAARGSGGRGAGAGGAPPPTA